MALRVEKDPIQIITTPNPEIFLAKKHLTNSLTVLPYRADVCGSIVLLSTEKCVCVSIMSPPNNVPSPQPHPLQFKGDNAIYDDKVECWENLLGVVGQFS